MDKLDNFSENNNLTPVTPNDARLTCDSVTYVEGLKLINVYESYGNAMWHARVIAFFMKMTFGP